MKVYQPMLHVLRDEYDDHSIKMVSHVFCWPCQTTPLVLIFNRPKGPVEVEFRFQVTEQSSF